MLSKEIREFVDQMKTLNAVGCILAEDSSLKKLAAMIERTDDLGIPWEIADKKTDIASIPAPAIIVASEKEYSSDSNFAGRLRAKAEYFLNCG